MMGPEIELCGS